MRLTNGGQYSDPALIHLISTLLARKYRAEKIANATPAPPEDLDTPMNTTLIATAVAIAAACATLTAQADSWKDLKDVAKQQAAQRAESELGLPQAATAGAKVYIISPQNDAEVSSPVKVLFGLSGMGVAPAGVNQAGTGHHHLLIDNPEVDFTKPLAMTDQIKHFGGGQTEASIELKPGTHTLQLVLGDWKHQPQNPAVLSEKITITVK